MIPLLARRFFSFSVPPDKIALTMIQADLARFLGYHPRPGVLGGDWDLEATPFDQSPVFVSFAARFREGVAWRDTPYYELLSGGFLRPRVIKNGGVDGFLSYYDRFFHDVASHGFDPKRMQPILINGGRSGSFIRHDGSHRLAIAKVLGLPNIPVRYYLIHPLH